MDKTYCPLCEAPASTGTLNEIGHHMNGFPGLRIAEHAKAEGWETPIWYCMGKASDTHFAWGLEAGKIVAGGDLMTMF